MSLLSGLEMRQLVSDKISHGVFGIGGSCRDAVHRLGHGRGVCSFVRYGLLLRTSRALF